MSKGSQKQAKRGRIYLKGKNVQLYLGLDKAVHPRDYIDNPAYNKPKRKPPVPTKVSHHLQDVKNVCPKQDALYYHPVGAAEGYDLLVLNIHV